MTGNNRNKGRKKGRVFSTALLTEVLEEKNPMINIPANEAVFSGYHFLKIWPLTTINSISYIIFISYKIN